MTAPTTPEERTEAKAARVDVLGWAVLVLAAAAVALLILFVRLALPQLLAGADASKDTKQGNELAACRSEYASRVTSAGVVRDNVLFDGFVAVVTDDEETVRTLVAVPAPGELSAAEQARHDVDVANQAYRRAVTLSRTDPVRFIRECKELSP